MPSFTDNYLGKILFKESVKEFNPKIWNDEWLYYQILNIGSPEKETKVSPFRRCTMAILHKKKSIPTIKIDYPNVRRWIHFVKNLD